MRPRVFPAEDISHGSSAPSNAGSFNEAAGIPRGRRKPTEEPNPNAGGFNEAAGIPRGRLAMWPLRLPHDP